MPHVVIVGDRESGKATFLSLLYATQVHSGSAASDAFRFHADVASLDEISEAFEQLMSGSFPDSATKEGMRGITFHLGYRRAGRGFLSRFRSRGWDAGGSIALHFILVRNVEEEMSRFLRGSSLTNAEDRKSTRLNSSHQIISYAVFCLKKKKKNKNKKTTHTNPKTHMKKTEHP